MLNPRCILAASVFWMSGQALALETAYTDDVFSNASRDSSRASSAIGAKADEEPSLKAVASAEIDAIIVVNGEEFKAAGRSSLNLSASRKQLEQGEVELVALNIILFDVKQSVLNYSGDRDEKVGTLSFVLDGAQSMKYDARRGTLSGQMEGFIGADYMAAYAEEMRDSKEGDHVEAPRQRASMEVRLQLEQPIEMDEIEETRKLRGEMNVALNAERDQKMNAYGLELRATPVLVLEYVYWWRFEIAKRLCVQPVRFRKLTWSWPTISVDYTGAGLAFGQPEANKQWAKGDVLFTWRPWKTVNNNTLFDFSIGEQSAVMATVDDADCVEVFFVEGDSGMHNGWGGGASWYGGEAYTKIISSDGNAAGGIDKVHLAHELGHSMDLPHPNSWNSASTNTLMCPSGFANDNPARNSQENKDNISNPLFTFALKFVSAGPNCTNSADCGSCP